MSPTEIDAPHAVAAADVLAALETSVSGLAAGEAARRLERYGRNSLPHAAPPGVLAVFVRQFLSPLIYILLAAAVVSLLLGDSTDAVFIFVVLLLNAAIGTAQEYNAERSAEALHHLVVTTAYVVRGGEEYELDAEELVPGDVVRLESGSKVPADLRLLSSRGIEIDESLLTGESLPVVKDAGAVLERDAALGDRVDLAFAGTMVTRGRATGVVVATASHTELGRIARSVPREATRSPLLVRMKRFTNRVGIIVVILIVLLGAVAIHAGADLVQVFLASVGLAVAAIPEGLPVAITVALAIGMARMGRRNVIVRRLPAVEALGSCTVIASDKTGTLTLNELTVKRVLIPGQEAWEVTGEGMIPAGEVVVPSSVDPKRGRAAVDRLCQAAVLCNDAFLGRHEEEWRHHGDTVDVALLVMAHKAGWTRPAAEESRPRLDTIPFESERLFAATLHRAGDSGQQVFLKGAVERVLAMCSRMSSAAGDVPLDRGWVEQQGTALAEQGFRVLALAASEPSAVRGDSMFGEEPRDLTLLGLVGMIDPLRPEARPAIAACRSAGITVKMVTGDHPVTALAIAREIGLADRREEVVTGAELKAAGACSPADLDSLVERSSVFARVEPSQKLDIVRSLARRGHFVAVTGDGANDAPALRTAHVGVAMGKRGTDVARETSDLILTDDNFASIVAGIQEGRIAYENIRKVVFLLVSTGAAEIAFVALAMLTGEPIPLFAAQLLWLNLVTNGIQDVALAFEPGEGDELAKPPRPPRETVFNRSMIERCLLSAAVMGGVTFAAFAYWLDHGWSLADARNSALLLLVLFENVQVGNSRSESQSAFRLNPLRNPLLLLGTIAAQLLHIAAMYTPGLRDVLRIHPVSLAHWLELLVLALALLAAMEAYKWAKRRKVW